MIELRLTTDEAASILDLITAHGEKFGLRGVVERLAATLDIEMAPVEIPEIEFEDDGIEFEDDGQPDEYTEWQAHMGGDDWDHGQYDDPC